MNYKESNEEIIVSLRGLSQDSLKETMSEDDLLAAEASAVLNRSDAIRQLKISQQKRRSQEFDGNPLEMQKNEQKKDEKLPSPRQDHQQLDQSKDIDSIDDIDDLLEPNKPQRKKDHHRKHLQTSAELPTPRIPSPPPSSTQSNTTVQFKIVPTINTTLIESNKFDLIDSSSSSSISESGNNSANEGFTEKPKKLVRFPSKSLSDKMDFLDIDLQLTSSLVIDHQKHHQKQQQQITNDNNTPNKINKKTSSNQKEDSNDADNEDNSIQSLDKQQIPNLNLNLETIVVGSTAGVGSDGTSTNSARIAGGLSLGNNEQQHQQHHNQSLIENHTLNSGRSTSKSPRDAIPGLF